MPTLANGGNSLPEVLISLLVLSGGVIGAAGMQLFALQMTQHAAFHSRAVQLASEMADTLRSHTALVTADVASNPFLAIDHHATGKNTIPVTDYCYGKEQACNAQQHAAFDIARWLQRIEQELPGARVRICRDARPWDAATQRYTWSCNAQAVSNAVAIKIGWPDRMQDAEYSTAHDKDFAPVLVLAVASSK